MKYFFPNLKISKVFSLSLLFLTFIVFIVVTIFSSFIFNNSRLQLIDSLYLQAQTINKLIPQNSKTVNFDDYANNLAISNSNNSKLRVTIIDQNWDVIGDSLVDYQKLDLLEKHSPETRIEIKDAINNEYGTTTRKSDTTGVNSIYVAILRDRDNIESGILRVALPFDIGDTFFNFFIYPFIILFILVIASSSFLSLNVENSLRRELDVLLNNTKRALKGKSIKSVDRASDEQIESLSNAVKQISISLKNEIEQAMDQRIEFGTVLDSMNQGVIIFNKNFKVRFSNDIALEIFGKHQFFLGDKITSKELQPLNKLLKQAKKNSTAEIEMDLNLDKDTKHLLLSASEMESTNEFIIVISDISSLRKLENLRKKLITDISHEIKTPVSVIRAGSETLHSGKIADPEITKKFTKSILENSERLSEMIEDLLELEKIEFGGLVIKNEKINPHNEINLVINIFDTLLIENNITVENTIDRKLSIKTDKESFRSIFSNLLNNAIKYSSKDTIITFRSSNKNHQSVISIKDQGYGIEKNSIHRIFDRFYRTSKARAHTKGTGLGLSLVKQLSSRIGAKLDVHSKINSGSEFFVSFNHK